MKKVIAILLALCLCISLSACVNMDRFKDNLGSDYKKMTLDDDELEDYANMFDMDVYDYDVRSAIHATHKESNISVVVIECGSGAAASQLTMDAEVIIVYLELYYGYPYSFDIERNGNFVLIGEEAAIEDALGR